MKKKKVSGIYRIINTINNKCYIGSSKDIDARIKNHFWKLESNRHPNIYLQTAFNKYGLPNFRWEIVEEVEEFKLLIVEQKYLNEMTRETNYNLATSAKGGGSNVIEKEVITYDIHTGEVNLYKSGSDMMRSLNIKRGRYGNECNNFNKVSKSYWVFSPDYFNENYDSILEATPEPTEEEKIEYDSEDCRMRVTSIGLTDNFGKFV